MRRLLRWKWQSLQEVQPVAGNGLFGRELVDNVEFVEFMGLTGCASDPEGAARLSRRIIDMVTYDLNLDGGGLKLTFVKEGWSSSDDGGFLYSIKYAVDQDALVDH